ncbi:hypothetical protein P879_09484 [Paragonimus westermani]|uniref:Uncharacterized protein n=1 Tax=Paragonimus westermani TaxID=34504 RepID=A0A8T0DF14_9TREM|nr:hypothetical protein P879_09484 [Paragonimus westermani]
MLAYFMATLENARTSLPAHGPKSSLGHPVAHFLDCLPYRVPLVRAPSQCADSASTIVGENAPSSQPKDDQEDFQLAVCLMQTKSTLFDHLFDVLPTDVETVFAYLNATLVALCAVPEGLLLFIIDCPINILHNPYYLDNSLYYCSTRGKSTRSSVGSYSNYGCFIQSRFL